jgi:hypothetical protein
VSDQQARRVPGPLGRLFERFFPDPGRDSLERRAEALDIGDAGDEEEGELT